jgi:hypothetical protein
MKEVVGHAELDDQPSKLFCGRAPDTPLLQVIHEDLTLTATKCGCGIGQRTAMCCAATRDLFRDDLCGRSTHGIRRLSRHAIRD